MPTQADEHSADRGLAGFARALSAPLRQTRRELPGERVKSRVSAYVYGNVLVLGSVLTASPHALSTGIALLVVTSTTVTTYAAHVFAHDVSARVQASRQEHQESVREELADAMPIIYSGVVPVIVLALAAFGPLSTAVAQPLAAVALVVRLAIIAWRIEALSGRPASSRSAWSGVGLALVGGLIALAKSALHF